MNNTYSPIELKRVICMVCCALLCSFSKIQAANVLLVTQNNGSLTSEESSRKSQFEAWGHTVTTVWDGDTQSNYNAQLASSHVVYVSEEVNSSNVGYKLRTTTAGVIVEELDLNIEMGIATLDGDNADQTMIEVLDNSHPVSSGLANGFNTIFTSTQPRAYVDGTPAAGMLELAQRAAGQPVLGVIETGGSLANSYSGNSTASGRRVRLPWGGSAFQWSSLNTSGLSIVQNALAWASGGGNGLIGHWILDETSGTSAADSSGNGHDGTYTNGVTLGATGPPAGHGSTAAQFDGSDDHVSIPDESAFDITDAITVAVWIKVDSFDVDYQAIITKGEGAWRLSRNGGTNTIHFACSGLSTGTLYGNVSVNDNKWHHVTGVYDGTTIKLYVDGRLDVAESSTGSISTTNSPVLIGRNSEASGREWDGSLFDVRVYDRALSESEIAELSGFIGHWKFDEGSGTTIADASLNANDASFDTGSPNWVAGIRGSALEFNGSNDADTNATFEAPDNGTVAFWFRTGGAPATRERLFGASTTWEVRYETNGQLAFDLAVGTGFNGTTYFILPERWHHVVATYSKDNGTYSFYMNGELKVTSTFTFSGANPGILTFGTRTGSSEHFSGVIDDLRVYNYEISSAQVAEIYGLIGHWKLTDSSGTTATDSSGSGLNGTYTNGPTLLSSGPYPGFGAIATSFDGEDDYVSIPKESKFDLTDAISIAAWFKADAFDADYQTILSKGDYTWRLSRYGSSNVLHFACSGLSNEWVNGSMPVNDNKWHHAVGVYDGTSIRLYVDGQLDIAESTSGTISTDNQLVAIGRNSQVGGRDWNGSLHDVRIYNRALLDREVAELYGLVGNWKLDETSGSVAVDSTVMAKHGTYTGGVTLNQSGPKNTLVSAQFDGFNDHVELPLYTTDFRDGYAMSAWARPTSSGYWARFIELGNGTDQDNFFLSRNDTAASLDSSIHQGSLGGTQRLTATGVIVNNEWHHYAASISPTGYGRLYVDGIEVATNGIGTPGKASRVNNFIGKSNWVVDDFFQGKMWDVRLYNRPLSVEEVQAAYNDGIFQGVRIIRWEEAL